MLQPFSREATLPGPAEQGNASVGDQTWRRDTMIIGFDGRPANDRERAGIGNICFDVLCAMARARGGDTLRVYLDAQPRHEFPVGGGDVEFRILPKRRFWTQRILAKELRHNPPDVYYTATMQMPMRGACPKVATLLDLAYYDFADQFTWRRRTQARLETRMVLRKAAHLMSISHATKDHLLDRFSTNPDRVTVAHLGVSEDFAPSTDPAVIDALRKKFGLPSRFILFVGRIQPRKNIVRLVQAFEQLVERKPKLPHHLVIAGHTGWLFDEILHTVENSPVKKRIQMLGYVHHEKEMPTLLSLADVLALVSLWEGFGMPLAEAMKCGTAVLTSDCSSMPEVVGDAGLAVNPYDVDAIRTALERIVTDDTYRSTLEQRGVERAKAFTWDEYAQRTLRVLRKLGKRT